MYRVSIVVKLFQSFFSVIVQIVVVARLSHGFNDAIEETRVIIIISLLSAMYTFVMSGLNALLHSKVLRNIFNDDDDSSLFDADNSIQRLTYYMSTGAATKHTYVSTLTEYIRVLGDESSAIKEENNVMRNTINALSSKVIAMKKNMSNEIEDINNHLNTIEYNKQQYL